MLLDTDTQNSNCGANVTVDKLNEIGFGAAFLTSNVFFAGVQEFEDIFPDSVIRDVFNRLYKRPTKGKWTSEHIKKLRSTYPKLSKGFFDASKLHITHHKKIYKKPEFATELADSISEKDLKKIQILTDLFQKVHSIVD